MKLYSFFNSSASYRVRIALALKGINYQTEGVNIRIGQQNELAYRRMNPVGLVPTLLTDEGESLGQSLAIIDWLERHYPQVPLVPQEEPARNKVLEIVYAIACDIHPLNNLRVLRYLTEELNVSEEEKKRWYAHWIQQGLSAVEQLLRQKINKIKFQPDQENYNDESDTRSNCGRRDRRCGNCAVTGPPGDQSGAAGKGA